MVPSRSFPSILLCCVAASIVSVDAWSLADRILGRTPDAPSPRRRPSHSAFAASSPTSPFTALHSSPQYSSEQTFSWVGDEPSDLARDNEEALGLLQTIVAAADGRKAENIVALCVAPVTTLARYLVVVSGNSRPQNQAIANAVKKDVEEAFQIRPGATGVPEGSADSGWMLLDFGSVMVHVMTPKSRLYYNIEGQWFEKGGQYIDVSEYLMANAPAAEAPDTRPVLERDEEDPFWS